MVEYRSNTSDAAGDFQRVFSAIADRTRRSIMDRLSTGPATVTDLAKPFRMSLQAVSKHLMVLEQAGLVKRRIEGRVHHLSLNAAPLASAAQWINRYRRILDTAIGFVGNIPG